MALEVLVSFEKGCFLTERKSVCEREREREREEKRGGEDRPQGRPSRL
jgi:hypothetical protein